MNRSQSHCLLEAHSISHAFDYPLFDEVDIKLYPKESLAVVGKSGSGKSTLLHILSTLLPPLKGIISLLGMRDIYALPQKKLLLLRREAVGIVFQSHYLFKGFSAKENVEVAALLAKEPIDKKLIERFGIAHVMQKRVSDLSGGEQQRVSIARVLTKKPKIIFADEPTGNLDSATAKEVMDAVFEYIKEHDAALFLVTHDADLAKRCHHLYELKKRRLHPLQ